MRYVITGGSGYLGNRLIELVSAREETDRVVNLDVRPPDVPWPKTEFVHADIRDRPAMRELLERESPDALIHLAFVFNPIHDEARMYDIDVNGTHAVLWAASEAGTEHVVVTSSASAYGAFPDNPKPITEDWPVRGAPDFSYACHKAEADRVCQLWAAEHPDRVMTILRPCIVFGPNVDNFISRGWLEAPFMPILDGVEEDFQLVHEDDLVEALVALLDKRAGGAFNVAADGTLTWRESGEMVGLKTREVKLKTMQRFADILWRLHLPRAGAPAGNLAFQRYPWVVSNEKLKAETGWQPSMNTREVFELTMRAKGKLPPAPIAA